MKLTARHALTGTMLVFLLSASAGFLVAHAPSALAQPAGNQAQPSETISVGELDSILAPIALYPDDLLSQMLMAATYPDEVVDANQWLQEGANASLTGDTLISAIDQAPWDPSVKSLVPFPQALKMLADNIEWTTKLGSVFANQQGEVMAEIQKLRHQARAAGKLGNSAEMIVRDEGPDIIIEPASADDVALPMYDPNLVYGTWAYPDYPPVFFPWPFDVRDRIYFGRRYVVVRPLWGWARFQWGFRRIGIDAVFFNRINRFGHPWVGGYWRHVAHPFGYYRAGPGWHRALPVIRHPLHFRFGIHVGPVHPIHPIHPIHPVHPAPGHPVHSAPGHPKKHP